MKFKKIFKTKKGHEKAKLPNPFINYIIRNKNYFIRDKTYYT